MKKFKGLSLSLLLSVLVTNIVLSSISSVYALENSTESDSRINKKIERNITDDVKEKNDSEPEVLKEKNRKIYTEDRMDIEKANSINSLEDGGPESLAKEIVGKKENSFSENEILSENNFAEDNFLLNKISENGHTRSISQSNSDNFISSVHTSSNKLKNHEKFDFSMSFSAKTPAELPRELNYKLSQNEKISIVTPDGSYQSVDLEKDGVIYGKATLYNNNVNIMFYDNLYMDNIENIYGNVRFEAAAELIEVNDSKIGKTVTTRIELGSSEVEIEVENPDYDEEPDYSTSDSPFFHTGRLDNDNKISWGFVFNQFLNGTGGSCNIEKPVEIFLQNNDQMTVSENLNDFSISIHNRDYMYPDSTINEYLYPVNIRFEENKNEGCIDIIAEYTDNFWGRRYFTGRDVLIGKIFYHMPSNPVPIRDYLAGGDFWGNYHNDSEKIENIRNFNGMYVVLTPGFLKDKFITFNYKTTINKSHKKDKVYESNVKVSYDEKNITLGETFKYQVKRVSGSADMGFEESEQETDKEKNEEDKPKNDGEEKVEEVIPKEDGDEKVEEVPPKDEQSQLPDLGGNGKTDFIEYGFLLAVSGVILRFSRLYLKMF